MCSVARAEAVAAGRLTLWVRRTAAARAALTAAGKDEDEEAAPAMCGVVRAEAVAAGRLTLWVRRTAAARAALTASGKD